MELQVDHETLGCVVSSGRTFFTRPVGRLHTAIVL